MSRCFPFPPPGYEKKIHTTHSDILKKEKHREKKHKKEKKDREKKDRDKSDGKSKDKKDKKEKRRDKKKEKERDKDRQSDNPNTLAEPRHKVQPEEHNGQNVIQKKSDVCIPPAAPIVLGRAVGYNEGYHGHYASLAERPNGARCVHSADRTIRDDAERGGGQMMCEKIVPMSHKRNEDGGKFYHNSHLGNNLKDSNLALELDRRLQNEAEQPYDQSQTANKLIGANQKRDAGVIKSVPSHIMGRGDKRNTGSNGRYLGDKSAEVTLVPYASGLGQGNHDRMHRPSLGSVSEKKTEGQEITSHLEDELQQRGKKRKDKDRNGDGKSHGKHKSKEKERKGDKVNSRSDQKSAEQGTQETSKMDILCALKKETLHRGEYNNSSIYNGEKLNQAKGFLTNGFAHVTGPSVLSRPASLQNVRAPEPCQKLLKPSPDGQGATSTFKMDKVGKINGVMETLVQRPATEQVVQARPRSPHPDAKRLVEILAVPKIEELSEIDDSDWLISSKEGPKKKHKVDDARGSTTADTPRVWSKAIAIESADVYALPYVIPY